MQARGTRRLKGVFGVGGAALISLIITAYCRNGKNPRDIGKGDVIGGKVVFLVHTADLILFRS